MKSSSWLAWGVVVGFAGFGAGSSARAQQAVVPVTPLSAVVAPGGFASPPVVGGAWAAPAGSVANVPGASARSGAIMPYSYYVNFPEPSRIYVGYGPNDGFPFQGNLYGHAGDRWSWSAMSTGGGSLARYYYQILR